MKIYIDFDGTLFNNNKHYHKLINNKEIRLEDIINKYNSIYRVQLPTITPHVCRHTHASILSEKGVNVKHIQYLLGHSDIRMSMGTYIHTNIENVIQSVKKLDKQPVDKKLVSE